MEERGIIKGYQTLLDFDKINLTVRAFILFKVHALKHKELIKLVESIPEVVEWHTITGNYAILIKISAPTSERLAGIIEQLEELGETNTSLILSKNYQPVVIKRPC
jgi:DNA-binding Lrp family transcriptional regulator